MRKRFLQGLFFALLCIPIYLVQFTDTFACGLQNDGDFYTAPSEMGWEGCESIQDALDAINNYHSVYLWPGQYIESDIEVPRLKTVRCWPDHEPDITDPDATWATVNAGVAGYDGRGFIFEWNGSTNGGVTSIYGVAVYQGRGRAVNGDDFSDWQNWSGAGIRIRNSSPIIDRCLIYGCETAIGGGVAVITTGGYTHPQINNTLIWYNTASEIVAGGAVHGPEGGGLYVQNGTYPTYSSSTITLNSPDDIDDESSSPLSATIATELDIAIDSSSVSENTLKTVDFKGNSEEALKNLKESNKFLIKNKEKDGIITTKSGLQYEIIEKGNGRKAKQFEKIVVELTGQFIDGTEFMSTACNGKPINLQVDAYLPAWREAAKIVRIGGKYRFYVPAELTTGALAYFNKRPNSALIFDIEVLDIIEAQPDEILPL